MKMKFKHAIMAFAALATVGLTSCNNDDDKMPSGKGENAVMNITVTAPGTKAANTTAPAATDDTSVTGFTAFIVDADNSVSRETSTSASLSATVKTSIKGIYVIANAGSTDFSSITTLQDLNDYLANLAGVGAQTASRWASGYAAVAAADFVEQADNSLKASKSIALTFVAARITLKIATGGDMATDYDATATDGSLVLENVAVLNARGASHLFGTSLIPTDLSTFTGKKFYGGIDDASFTNWPAAADFTTYAALNDAIPADDFSQYYYFYVFENDATAPTDFPTIITVIGEFDGEKVYYPVHLAPYENALFAGAVERGKSYDITVTLKGDPKIGGDGPGGGEDPTDPIVTAALDVAITITNWTPVVFNKDF